MSNLATAELVFPFKSIPLVIAGIPENLLSLHGPEVQSCYHHQVLQCGLDFDQKVTACSHVHYDHLNVALACLYCSYKDNPRMHFYSATAWENHTAKHCKDNLSIFPDKPEFAEKFQPQSGNSISPSTPKQLMPHEGEIIKWVHAAKCFFGEEQATPVCLVPKKEELNLSALEQQAPLKPIKCHVKQGPIKSSKKVKVPKLKEDVE